VKGKEGKFSLDLGYAVEVTLIGAGLTGPNIDRLRVCTRCAASELFSYRGSNGICGRNMGFIRAERGVDHSTP